MDIIFKCLDIEFDWYCFFEKYFRGGLFDSAIPEDGAYELLEYLKREIYSLWLVMVLVSSRCTGWRLPMKYFDYIFVSERIRASKPSKVFLIAF